MQASDRLPWEIHPALNESRLVRVGQIIWNERKGAADDARWEKGDYLWNIGCNAYVRTRYAIMVAAKGELKDWLSLSSEGLYFVFKIGGVPIRFYRGDPDGNAPENYAHASPLELLSLQTAFQMSDTPTPDAYFRIVVKTDTKGLPLGVSLVQVNDLGAIQNPWKVPVITTGTVRHIGEAREQGVELPPPPVGDEVEDRKADRTKEDNTNGKTREA